MKAYKKNTIIVLMSIATLFSQCQKEVDVTLPYLHKKLVINSLINSSEPIVADVSFTRPTTDTLSPLYIENAEVIISREEVAFDTLKYSSFTNKYMGTKIPNFKARYYKITVKAPDFKNPANGKATIPTNNAFVSANFTPNVGIDDEGLSYGEIKLTLKDDGSKADFYNLKLDYFNTNTNKYSVMPIKTSDPSIDIIKNKQSDGSVLFGDKIFNGKNYTITLRTEFGSGPKFRVSLLTIGEEYSRYLSSVERANQGTLPPFFETAPTIVYSNIDGGLGIFAGAYKHIELLN